MILLNSIYLADYSGLNNAESQILTACFLIFIHYKSNSAKGKEALEIFLLKTLFYYSNISKIMV